MQQVRPQMNRPAMAAGRPNPAAPARPQAAARPAATPQARAAERREAAGSANRPEQGRQAGASRAAEAGRPLEPRQGMGAGRTPAALGGGTTSAQSRFNEHVRDPARERETAQVHEHDFHTRDVRRFNVSETAHWRTGRWHNDWHYGRFGWWYEVDDVWYAYPAPIFPYPLIVAPIVIEDAVGPVVDGPPPPAAIGLEGLALPKAAYHCGDPEGFFPAVEECNVEWVAIGAH